MKGPRYLFVYGTLMKGGEANELLKGARFVSKAKLQGGRLYDLGEYPAVVKTDDLKDTVVGELYELTELDAIRVLDEHEDYDPAKPNSTFVREEVNVVTLGDSERNVRAWAYFYNPFQSLKGAKPISSGDYRAAKVN